MLASKVPFKIFCIYVDHWNCLLWSDNKGNMNIRAGISGKALSSLESRVLKRTDNLERNLNAGQQTFNNVTECCRKQREIFLVSAYIMVTTYKYKEMFSLCNKEKYDVRTKAIKLAWIKTWRRRYFRPPSALKTTTENMLSLNYSSICMGDTSQGYRILACRKCLQDASILRARTLRK